MFLARVSLVALTIASAVTASPLAARYAVHEKRDRIPKGWENVGKLPADMTLPMRIALKQSNLHLGHGHLMDVSDPTSESYGQHWSAERIAEYFAPSQESEDAVKSWLVSSGIAIGRISRSFGQGWLELQATAREIESLLQTDLHMYRHESGQGQVACTKYSLPESLREHIDFITPTVHFDAQLSKRTDKSQLTRRDTSGGPIKGSKFVPTSFAVKSPDQGKSAGSLGFSPDSLAHCDKNITLDCLRALYKIPPGITANPKNSFGITEYLDFYLPTDLDMFFSVFAPEMVGDRPILNSIDGGTIYYPQESFGFNGEADLDLQYAMGLVYPQKVQLFQVGDNVEGASFNTFLDALDASYCTYDGGDDPTQDPIYPDPHTNDTGAYEGPKACGTYEPTWVISTSHGYAEVDLTPFYEER
jgi:tripeptidyl-peptidase-1